MTHASTSRREFLARSGVGAAALAAGSLLRTNGVANAENVAGANALAATAVAGSALTCNTPRADRYPIGLELYSVRGELARDLPNTLRTVAQFGYQVVEFYAPYMAWTIPYAKDVHTMLDDNGLRCYSTHNAMAAFTPGDMNAKAIEINQILGARQMILASAPNATAGVDGWKNLCDQLTVATMQLKPHGLTAGFHNHHAEWTMLANGQRIMDVITANTPQEFVLQFDVGTCVEAGADPVAWITANPGRIKSVHLKDWAPGTSAVEKGYRVLFGEGVVPWRDVLAAAEATGGVEFYLMEQEGSRYSEFETAKRCLAAWRTIRGD